MGAVVDIQTDGAGVIVGEAWPLVPDGIYEAVFQHHETGYAFGAPRVFLIFKIITPGKFFGAKVYRAFRVLWISGKKRKSPAFKAPRNGGYVREMAMLLKPARLDRITPLMLRNLVLKVRIEVVKQDHRQRLLSPTLQYSVVRELLEVKAGTHT